MTRSLGDRSIARLTVWFDTARRSTRKNHDRPQLPVHGAQEERREHRLEADDDRRERDERSQRELERAEPVDHPAIEQRRRVYATDAEHCQSGRRAVFERQRLRHPLGDRILGLPDGIARHGGEYAQRADLIADDRQQAAGDHGMDPEVHAADGNAGERGSHDDHADDTQQEPRGREQVARRVHEHEPDVAPPVSEALEGLLALPLVVDDRGFDDVEVLRAGLHDHLAGELHPGRLEVHRLVGLFREDPEAAVGVAHPGPVEGVQELRQERIADVLMQ